ncbi:hypothetical protein ACIP98_32105 [Streptomyces sp. NPDC088354]|uniref:hypothetical protein n=1 Tax=Streptomyces sp. NPDC088354 TaxID=3365856 RepID=UPI0038281D13
MAPDHPRPYPTQPHPATHRLPTADDDIFVLGAMGYTSDQTVDLTGLPSGTVRALLTPRPTAAVPQQRPPQPRLSGSAFLAVVFVLAREGIALDGVSLLRRVTFQADEPQDALTLTRYIDIPLAETRRNTASLGS